MRKILLATTALAGIALFSGTASAGMEVTVGGYNDFRAGFFDSDLPTGVQQRSEDFQDEFQLEIEAKAKASNGMEYGVVASLWNGPDYTTSVSASTSGHDETFSSSGGSNSMRIHQAYGYVNGAWGQLRMGDEHGASDFGVAAPQSYDFGAQVNGAYTEFVDHSMVWAVRPSFVDDVENNTKVSYFTPKFGMSGHKFQLGVSYTPNWYDSGDNVILNEPVSSVTPEAGDAYKNVFEVGGGYEGTWFDKISAKAGFVVTTAENVSGALFTNGGGVEVRDFTAWNIGGQVGYAGFTVGGNYVDAGTFNAGTGQNRDQNSWSVGASYKFDRASIAASYLSAQGYNNMLGGTVSGANAQQDNYVDGYEAWGVGAGYSLFDGMVTSVDAVFFDQSANTAAANAADNNGHVIILSNRISF